MDKNVNAANNDLNNFLLAAIIATPVLPATAIAGLWFAILKVFRLPSVIAGGVSIVSIIPFLSDWKLITYLVGWITLVFGVESSFFPNVPTWPKIIAVSIPAGLIGGSLLYCLLPQKLLPQKAPCKKHTIIDDIMKGVIEKKFEKNPPDGVFLGVDDRKPVVVSETEMNQHTLLVGTTGSGKTTTLKTYLEFGFKNDFSVIVVDGKGEWGYAQEIRRMAEVNGREIEVFSLNHPDQSSHYNPLAIGNPTELKDRLVSCFDWTEPHYYLGSSRYLQLAFQVLRATGEPVDLPMLVRNLARIEALARQVGAPDDILLGLSDIDEKTKAGIVSRLALLSESSIGDLLESDGREIDLLHTTESGGAAMFSLDKLAYPAFARQLGIMVINDLKACAARCGHRKTMLIFDEFGTFASSQVVDLVNAARSFGFCVVMATQSLADLDRVDGALRRQIVGNVNTVIVQRQNDAQDAELLAVTIGTRDSIQLTRQIQDNAETELGSLRETKEFLVHPDQIKRLKTGEAIVLRKFPEFRVHHIRQIRNV